MAKEVSRQLGPVLIPERSVHLSHLRGSDDGNCFVVCLVCSGKMTFDLSGSFRNGHADAAVFSMDLKRVADQIW